MIQVMDYQLTVEQASNNDILKELKKDMAKLTYEISEIKNLLQADCKQIQ